MRIGIYGGSFNPIHNGHIAIARQLLDKHLVDEVWLMVSPQNPLKAETGLLDEQERLRLAQKALRGIRNVLVSDFEFRLPRPSYTWNTLRALSSAYPQHRFSLVIGADNWEAFSKWKFTGRILSHYHVLVYPRQGYDVSEDNLPEGVTLVRMPLFNVSSTLIRSLIGRGEQIDGLVPSAIKNDVIDAYRSLGC